MDKAFEEFIKNYDLNNADINLKYNHSYRVRDLQIKYAKLLNYSKDDIEIAALIGLLHDVGRFEQLKNYNTYNDFKSLDHAACSVKMLFEDGLIKKFCSNEEWYSIIKFAIANHNKYEIESCSDERMLKHAQLIRDTDKLDIIYLYGTLHVLPVNLDGRISKKIVNNFKKHRFIKKKDQESKVDHYALKLAFPFNVYNDIVLLELKGYIINFYDLLKDNEDFRELYDEVIKYIDERVENMKELGKKYNHDEVEKDKYEMWLKNDYFKCDEKSDKKPYAIVLPPPNVTGVLHLGHAWDVTLQDIIIRYKKMEGFDTLWLPGMDHAAIATEAKVVKRLKDKGINKYEYGREKFLDACWDWTHEHGDIIRQQWAKMGVALDYSKERFTLDEGLQKAVKKVFVDFYNEGLIYRGEKIINWDPAAQTALSNEEVVYAEEKSAFYHLKYKLEDSEEFLDVATTRPETLFGDTAVAVNEKDKRYKKYVGKNVILPIVNKPIPVITDEHADMEKGTGCVKITPAHDPNDFEVGNRHNLERVVIMNDDATMNENVPKKYQGMTREACREEVLKDLEKEGLLLEVEPLVHEVGHSERTGVMVEPMIKKQWFVKMRPLADHLLEVQKKKNEKVNFVPSRYEKTMNHWMEITYDWCISRQLWWGHRIPAWYKDDEIYVGMEAPKGKGWVQDEDVLDTWFSSALWPFATLGWPDNTDLLKKYYPNQCLVTGYDIIPFWVNRMTFQGEKLLGERPFEHCLIHGLIRDKQGRKFSKSLGNGIDPFDMVKEYGADALRYYLATDVAPGTDMRFDEEKIKSTWNYINKIWNASRFALMNIGDLKKIKLENLKNEDKWILTKFEKTLHNVKKYMDKFQFNNAGAAIYDFSWNYFCDYYIEMAKYSLDDVATKSTLCYVLTGILKMLHPFMPYVTEEIYGKLPVRETESIMISEYPKYSKKYVFEVEEKAVDDAVDFIKKFRNIKAENNITKEMKVLFDTEDDNELIVKMLKLEDNIVKEPLGIKAYKVFSQSIQARIFFEKVETEAERIAKEAQIKLLKTSIERREKLLSNENYVNKAPANIVEMDRQKLEEEKKKLEELTK